MRSQFFKIRLGLFGFMRAAFAAFLLVAVLSEALLTGASSMSSASNLMSCCTRAGSPHSYACAGGVCHIKKKKRKKRFAASLPNEPLCGIKKENVELRKSTSEIFQQFLLFNAQYQRAEVLLDSSLDQHQHLPRVADSAFTQPCKSQCSSGAFGWTNQNGKGNKALIAHAQRPRPPTGTKTLLIEYLLAGKSKSARLSIRPRAPPAFS